MPVSKTSNDMTRAEVLAAVRAIPAQQNFIWDGTNQDERPASVEEMRVDNATLAAFKATGKGWQSRMNEALSDWIKTHR